ncbi:MAG TPA: tyrosine--tRNA ligase, partial [Candidatus Omnitrophota bacterium]|nr:tyrosine--tRNA ligase [Candidatus Omnitrophota bacterium]
MDASKQLEIIRRGAVEIINETALVEKLKKKKQLVIKAGFDPTAPDIHLGHTVLLRKLRHFQDLGHKVIFLIGDATALVGDPSGQTQARKVLSRDEVEANAKTYEKQVGKVLRTADKEAYERIHNSAWFSKFGFEHFVQLAQRYTVARLLERDDFQKRLREQKPVSFLELFYPLMQGYDSVMLDADVEVGGSDQKFNMLVGRDLQEAYGKEPQVVITMPLLIGTDGTAKMSKSYGNYIGINETAKEIFGKVMSVSDELMLSYYELLTDEDMKAVRAMHPMDAKKNLAYL